MKILYVTTISLTMNSFFVPHIEMLIKKGNDVDIACNCDGLALNNKYKEMGCKQYQVDFSRNPISLSNIRAYHQIKRIIEEQGYDVVHCHTPNASAIVRMASIRSRKKVGLKVYYSAHGFHFYKGASWLNWLAFYPVEKFCSNFTDKLITTNDEDYDFACRKLNALKTYYIPGVGVDLEKYNTVACDRNSIRENIGVPEDGYMIVSAGELNSNKNHKIIIEAIAKLNNPAIHYVIAGEGDKKEYLRDFAQRLGIQDQIHLIGFRSDLPELNNAADLFCFPSIREGLGLAAVEAMACGLPVVASENRGTKTIITDGENGLLCRADSAECFAGAINKVIKDTEFCRSISEKGKKRARDFSIEKVLELLEETYMD